MVRSCSMPATSNPTGELSMHSSQHHAACDIMLWDPELQHRLKEPSEVEGTHTWLDIL